MAEQIKDDSTGKARVKHDWTFFFFITIAFILVAAAITWASAKAGLFVSPDLSTDNESTFSTKVP